VIWGNAASAISFSPCSCRSSERDELRGRELVYLSATHSTVKVSLQVIVVTLPGLFVPFLGGVLIDRLDRRYLVSCLIS